MTEQSPFAPAAMDPCKASLAKTICDVIGSFNPDVPAPKEADVFGWMEKPPESKLGDFALPCFRFAKSLRLPPPKIAHDLKLGLENSGNPWFASAEVVGAFCNITIDKQRLAKETLDAALDGSHFDVFQQGEHSQTRVMLEFSQPNTHKEFHVGHGRNVCLGDSLCRINAYAGYQVVAANYIGDEGTHVAKCLWQMLDSGEPAPDEERVKWLGAHYARADRLLAELNGEEKATAEGKVSEILRQLESKSGQAYDLWVETRQWCLEEFNEIYQWLDVHFDHFFYESELTEDSQKIVDEYLAKGVFEVSDGAVGRNLEEHNLGFFLARKSDGNTLYGTKDLALARRKFEEFRIDRSVYIVGSEQNHHFKQVFKILELMGFSQAKQCLHLSYGMVVRPEGKMSSRKGNTITFAELQQQMTGELKKELEKYTNSWSADEIEDTVHKLSVGAIKYGMLSMDPKQEVAFDMKEWLSFEGNTGPYLMYSYARTQSILRKAKEMSLSWDDASCHGLEDPSAQDVVRAIYDFNSIVAGACNNYRPSMIANHLFTMCKTFNRFYAAVTVLKEEDQEKKLGRLRLLDSFAKTVKQGLYLLGITPPERM